MTLRNSEHGYGVVTKFLHWLTVAAISWTMRCRCRKSMCCLAFRSCCSAWCECLESLLEKVLLTLLSVVSGTGLLLIAGESDWLPVHIAAQLVLLGVIVVHVGLILSHTIVRRDGEMWRML
jgi:cytochrome b561